MSTQKPDKIGKYEVMDVLGRGGMGVVYRARDPRLGRVVAIKMLTEGFAGAPDMLRRFYEEANRHAALHHNNIVIVFDAGDQDSEPYIVMEFVEGEALDKTIKERKQIRPEIALSIVEQVCLALAYAHRMGVIHRDVKPANVIVQRNGTVKLLDFGIARDETRVDQTLTSTGTLVGTPPYMAPERFLGARIDGRSDIFSAGVLLYQMVTGRLPFDADYPAVIEQILHFEPPPPSELVAECPTAVDAIVARALAKSSMERYGNADDMAMDLHDIAEATARARVAELMVEAEQHVNECEFHAARTALANLIRLDGQHAAGKRLLSVVEQRLSEQEREREVQELTRLSQQASSERDWERALTFCAEALGLSPSNTALIALRQSIIDGKQTQERVAQLLQESANAREMGELTRAQTHAASAQRLDPHNSQIMALCKVLEHEILEKRHREELRLVLAAAKEHLAAREFEKASVFLGNAESISPDNADVLRLRDQLALALTEDRRKAAVRRLEEKAAVTTTVEKLRTVSADLANALKDFPNDPSLLRIRLNLEPRIKQLEDEQFVREVCRNSTALPPEEALAHIREALDRVPGNEQLFSLESALTERVTRQTRERQLAQRLKEATRAIDSHLYVEAVKILERCRADGFSSYEVDGLLELARAEGSKRASQEVLERTYSQAKRLIDQEDYESAVQLLRKSLRQVDEPVLRRQLEEAAQKQLATQQRADVALERSGNLIRMELFVEAVLLLEEQSAAVKRLPRVEQAMSRARKLQEEEAHFSNMTGRCYAQIGSVQGIEPIKETLKIPSTADCPSSHEVMKKQLRQHCEGIYGEKASLAIAAARKFLIQDDSQGAEEILQETMQWLELAPPQSREELRVLQMEAAAAKKILRFRKGLRR